MYNQLTNKNKKRGAARPADPKPAPNIAINKYILGKTIPPTPPISKRN